MTDENVNKKVCLHFLLYPMRSMGESIGIGLEASATSKGHQAKTTEHIGIWTFRVLLVTIAEDIGESS